MGEKEIVGFRTESGAEYAVKDGRAKRLEGSPWSPYIDYREVPDETWMDLATTVEVDGHVYMTKGFKFRQTTPVVEVYYE